MVEFSVRSNTRNQMIEITALVEEAVRDSGVQAGSVLVYVPHTTAGVTINENADPDVVHDILLTLEELIPHHRAGYRHGEGNSDSHVKASMMGSSAQVIIDHGRLVLGRWQGIYFCEFDGPRHRNLFVQVEGAA